MKIVGLTGGIGSGKTTIANLFRALGVAIYISDHEAKRLMHEHKVLKAQIIALLGEDAYVDNILNRAWIADKVFGDETLLKQLNALVHPFVAKDFLAWSQQQKGAYVIKEVAILFETGGQHYCDVTLLITAPKEQRIARVMKRDQVSRVQLEQRLRHQWDDAKKEQLADIVLVNTNLESTKSHVQKIHEMLESNSDLPPNIKYC